MNFSHVSYRARKKKAVVLLKNAKHLVFLAIFSCMIVQPQRFFVEPIAAQAAPGVYASYDELLAQSKQNDGSLSFENVAVNNEGQTTLTYKVNAGDTLGSIAKEFGTTIQVLAERNNINAGQVLRKGQELVILFTENFVYQVEETSTLEAFAQKYGLDVNDLMNLNYLTPPSVEILEGQELVLPLTKAEAKAKGLSVAEDFVPLDITEPTPEDIIEPTDDSLSDIPSADPEQRSLWIDDTDQEVITADQTEQHLKTIEEKRAQQQAEEKKKQEAKEKQAQQQAEEKKKQEELAKIKKQAQKTQPTKNNSCGANQCFHDGSCWSKPTNAVCAPQNDNDVWLCKEGFVDTGKSCVKKSTTKSTTSSTATKKVNQGVLKQWYFNASKTGYPYNGWARGHCTEYVDYRWWKNLGVRTYWRGNANRWYKSASAAGASVGKTPKYGAAAVFAAGTNSYRGYGHVGVVIDVDRDNNLILIEEQNYVGTYVVSQRWVSMNQPIGYVYPN